MGNGATENQRHSVKNENNLFFFALTINIGDLLLHVFDCITHAG